MRESAVDADVLLRLIRIVPIWTIAGPVNISWMFAGHEALVKVDERFKEFLKPLGSTYNHTRIDAKLYQTDGGTNESIKTIFGIDNDLDPNRLYAVVDHLSRAGFELLTIPEGEEEVNIIIGYADGVVYYVEHEFEDGEREIHLHARPEGRHWGDDKPLILVF